MMRYMLLGVGDAHHGECCGVAREKGVEFGWSGCMKGDFMDTNMF